MDDPPIERMRARAKQLRRIAAMAHDRSMTDMLVRMAGEVEADADRLEAELTVRPTRV